MKYCIIKKDEYKHLKDRKERKDFQRDRFAEAYRYGYILANLIADNAKCIQQELNKRDRDAFSEAMKYFGLVYYL